MFTDHNACWNNNTDLDYIAAVVSIQYENYMLLNFVLKQMQIEIAGTCSSYGPNAADRNI